VRTEAPEREILEQVVSKLAGVPGVPYADIASAAYKARRPDLATRVRAVCAVCRVSCRVVSLA
jgi:hypothetical protein